MNQIIIGILFILLLACACAADHYRRRVAALQRRLHYEWFKEDGGSEELEAAFQAGRRSVMRQ